MNLRETKPVRTPSGLEIASTDAKVFARQLKESQERARSAGEGYSEGQRREADTDQISSIQQLVESHPSLAVLGTDGLLKLIQSPEDLKAMIKRIEGKMEKGPMGFLRPKPGSTKQ